MTKALAVEMQGEVKDALDRVAKEAENPEVRSIGIVHSINIRIGGSAGVSAALAVESGRSA